MKCPLKQAPCAPCLAGPGVPRGSGRWPLAGGTVSLVPRLCTQHCHSDGRPRVPASREGGRWVTWLTASKPSGTGAGIPRECNCSGVRRLGLLLGGPPLPGSECSGASLPGRPMGVSAVPPVNMPPGREPRNCTRGHDSSRHARIWTGILFQNLLSRTWFCDYSHRSSFSSKN